MKLFEYTKTKNNFLKLKEEYIKNYAMHPDHIESPAYKSIISIGYLVVPFLIEELKNNEYSNWSYALYKITKEWPIPEYEKNTKKHNQYWIEWFSKNY